MDGQLPSDSSRKKNKFMNMGKKKKKTFIVRNPTNNMHIIDSQEMSFKTPQFFLALTVYTMWVFLRERRYHILQKFHCI